MNESLNNLAEKIDVTSNSLRSKNDNLKLDYTRSTLEHTDYLIYLKEARDNYFIEITHKEFIGNFFKNLKNNYPEIKSVLYFKDGNIITLYTFIIDDDMRLKKIIIGETSKLYEYFPDYLFDFMVYQLKYVKNFNNTELEELK